MQYYTPISSYHAYGLKQRDHDRSSPGNMYVNKNANIHVDVDGWNVCEDKL